MLVNLIDNLDRTAMFLETTKNVPRRRLEPPREPPQTARTSLEEGFQWGAPEGAPNVVGARAQRLRAHDPDRVGDDVGAVAGGEVFETWIQFASPALEWAVAQEDHFTRSLVDGPADPAARRVDPEPVRSRCEVSGASAGHQP